MEDCFASAYYFDTAWNENIFFLNTISDNHILPAMKDILSLLEFVLQYYILFIIILFY